MNTLINMQGITKVYHPGDNEVRALDGIDLQVQAGEYLAIVGRSGSGKSTLMNMVGCLDTPDSGCYELDGERVGDLSDARLSDIRNRQIGFIFQGFNLIAGLTALENVELPLIYRGMGRSERRRLSLDALERVGLLERIHHRPSQMSGGQQQRVAIARAIAARPPIVLADEPTGNLDFASGQEITRIIRELNREGHTIILITHDDTVAQEARRIIRIQDGRITGDENRTAG